MITKETPEQTKQRERKLRDEWIAEQAAECEVHATETPASPAAIEEINSQIREQLDAFVAPTKSSKRKKRSTKILDDFIDPLSVSGIGDSNGKDKD